MVRQSRFVIMRMYNNFHLTFSKNQNIIKIQTSSKRAVNPVFATLFLLFHKECAKVHFLLNFIKMPLKSVLQNKCF